MGLDVHDYFQSVVAVPASDLGDSTHHYLSISKRHSVSLSHHVDLVWSVLSPSPSRALLLSSSSHEEQDTKYHGSPHASVYESSDEYYSLLSSSSCVSVLPGVMTPLPAVDPSAGFSCVRVILANELYETNVPFHVEANDGADVAQVHFALYFEDDEHDDDGDDGTSGGGGGAHRSLLAAAHEEEVHYSDLFSFVSSETGDVVPFLETVSSEIDDDVVAAVPSSRAASSRGEPVLGAFIVNVVTLIGIIFLVPVARDLIMKTPVVTEEDIAKTSTAIVAQSLEMGGTAAFSSAVVLGGANSSCNTDGKNKCCDDAPTAAGEDQEERGPQGSKTVHNKQPSSSHDHADVLVSNNVLSPTAMLCISSFSAGCILATAFFLVLPEALHLIGGTVTEEAAASAHWGSFILAGFTLPYVTSFLIDYLGGAQQPAENLSGAPHFDRRRVICGCLIGDAFHNLADGVFIGAAFLNCSPVFGWVVVASSIFHELAQESADFFILTGPGGLNPMLALGANFLSGTTCVWGAMLVVYCGVPDAVVGYILALGGGVYLQVGAAECFPRGIQYATTMKLKAMAVLIFIVGALPIGLILLDHKHCEAEAEGGGGGGEHAAH